MLKPGEEKAEQISNVSNEIALDSCQVTGLNTIGHNLWMIVTYTQSLAGSSERCKISLCTGEIKIGYKFRKGQEGWNEAVKLNRVRESDDFDASECCQMCQEMYPETKAWEKNDNKETCNCLLFPDDFDASPYEAENGDYTIGYCNPKCKQYLE